jgi:hypothetical protein
MRPEVVIALGAVALLGGLGMYRWRRISHYPIGLGYNSFSPDKRYRAYATTLHDVSFFGRRSAFYSFEVEDCETQRTIAHHRTPSMREDDADDLSEPCIYWLRSGEARRVRVALGDRTYWEYEIAS